MFISTFFLLISKWVEGLFIKFIFFFQVWKKSTPQVQAQAQRKLTRKKAVKEEPKEYNDGEELLEPKKDQLEGKKPTRSVVKQEASPAQESNMQDKTREAGKVCYS